MTPTRSNRPAGVLLVPGWSDRARALRRLAESLLRDGWSHVYALEFEDRHGSNVTHALEIARAVERMRRNGHSEPAPHAQGLEPLTVDIVAHSMGGLAVRRYLEQCPLALLPRRVIFLATPHRGTYAAYLARGRGAREMQPGSDFLRQLEQVRLPGNVQAATIRSHLDLRVFPWSSATLTGALDHVVPFSTHRGLLRSGRAYRLLRDLLLARDLEQLSRQEA